MWEQECEDASSQNPDPNRRSDSRSTARQLAAPLLPTTRHFLETKSPAQPRERKFRQHQTSAIFQETHEIFFPSLVIDRCVNFRSGVAESWALMCLRSQGRCDSMFREHGLCLFFEILLAGVAKSTLDEC